MTEEIRRACRLAVDAGYRNIDIDSSTLVDLSQADRRRAAARELPARRGAHRASSGRSRPDGVTISVGGEIGEVGKQNSTVEELRAYLDGYRRELDRRARPARSGISKVSVQTGTTHGGVPLPDGGVAEVKLDFEVLRELGDVARAYGLAGAVQHGASTLPDELFHHFPAVETAEIHLATGFQNALYEHPAFPARLHREIEAWCYAERDRRAQARPDRPAVRVHDAQEGDRAVQAPALGARDEGRDPRRPATQDRRSCSPSSASTGRARWSTPHRPVELHRPMPEALRQAVGAG